MNKKVRMSKVLIYAGAFMAILIGSGFATGQELMQFFASYGLKGLIGVLICFVLFTFVGVEFVTYGHSRNLKNPNDVYKAIAGSKIGSFYDYFSVFFLFLSYTVMIAGAQATVVQQYNAPKYIGGILLGVLAIITVAFGLNNIVDVIGRIGPVIVVLSILIGGISIFKNASNLSQSLEILNTLNTNHQITHASDLGFLMASLTYVGFNMIWLGAFSATVGKEAENFKEAKKGQIAGAIGFSVAVLIMAFAIILSIGKLYDSQIPALILAGDISSKLGIIFSITIILGIYTSAVPLLWTPVARFFKEGTKDFKIATVLIGAAGIVVGLLFDFNVLVKYVYVINGYLGIVLLGIMLYKFFKRKYKIVRNIWLLFLVKLWNNDRKDLTIIIIYLKTIHLSRLCEMSG